MVLSHKTYLELTAEDDGTLNAHIQLMCTEMKKAVPSTAVIDDRTTWTLALRRQSVIDTPLPELLDKFTALKLSLIHI